MMVVEMPINADAQGPEMDPDKVHIVVWEVWDDELCRICVCHDEETAKLIAQRLSE